MTDDQNIRIKEFIAQTLRNELEDLHGSFHEFLADNEIDEFEGLSQYEHHLERIEVFLGL